MTEQPSDPLWDAVTWYAFVDGLLARSDGHEHIKGAYTIFSPPGFDGDRNAFTRPDPPSVE